MPYDNGNQRRLVVEFLEHLGGWSMRAVMTELDEEGNHGLGYVIQVPLAPLDFGDADWQAANLLYEGSRAIRATLDAAGE